MIVSPVAIDRGPVVNVIVPVTPASTTSPGDALRIASRREPGPLSAVLVTANVAPNAARAVKRFTSRRTLAFAAGLHHVAIAGLLVSGDPHCATAAPHGRRVETRIPGPDRRRECNVPDDF